MACIREIVDEALAGMAVGSQRDGEAVTAVSAPFFAQGVRNALAMRDATALAAAVHSLQDLVHVAGWLSPCFMPSSSLASDVKQQAWVGWQLCMSWVVTLLTKYDYLRHPNMEVFQRLVKARSRPPVPGGCALLVHSCQRCMWMSAR
jgi:hypothetical protein